jgi:DnaJ-class molecular chaperone
MKNYYGTLGVERTATHDQIVSAFRKLVLQYHPDRNHSQVASEMFIQVHEAYKVLANPSKRAEYDSRFYQTHPQPQPQYHSSSTYNYNTSAYTYSSHTNRPAWSSSGQDGLLKRWAPVVPLAGFVILISIFYGIVMLLRLWR